MHRTWTWILVVFLVGWLLCGCGETTTPERVEVDRQADPPVEQIEVFSMGETIRMGGLAITVNSVREDRGSEWLAPKDGHTYYIVDSTLENLSDKSEVVSSLMMFSLVDGEGYKYSVTFGPETRGNLDGELGAGRKMRGELVFEIPDDAIDLELVFEPQVLGFGQAVIAMDR
ncbi:MAG: DUF4352 domain-containing protein [Candidatus Desulforudis sp.]|nr:DUF4352 domain-containing protein [Desulforudis sp.]